MKKILIYFEELEPQYNLARKKINKKYFRKVILESLKIFKNIYLPSEWINKNIIQKNQWESFKNSLINLHTPMKKSNNFKIYRERLAYDELLSNFLIFDKLKKNKKKVIIFMLKTFHYQKE